MFTSQKRRRRWLFFAILLLLLFVLFSRLGYYRLPFKQPDIMEAVPQNSAIILEVASSNQLLNDLSAVKYSSDISSWSPVRKIATDLNLLHQSLKFSRHKDLLSKNSMAAAAQAGNSGDFDFLYIFENTKNIPESDLVEAGENLQTSRYKNVDIYTIKLPGGEVVLASYKGLLLAGRHGFLVEYAITQLNQFSNNIKQDKTFRRAYNSALKKENISLYINYKDWPLLAATFLDEGRSKETKNLQNFASWTSLNISFEQEGIRMKGYTHPSTDNLLLKALSDEKQPERTRIAQVLPNHTALMTSIGVRDFKPFYKRIKQANDNDFKEFILPWLGTEMAYVITEPHGDSFDAEQFAVMQVNNKEKAEQLLISYAKKWRKTEEEVYLNFKLRKLPAEDLLEPVFGKSLNLIRYPHYVLLNDYAIFANSRSALKLWIDKYMVGKTLDKSEQYLQFKEQMTETAGLYIYFNNARMLQLLKNYFNDKTDKSLEKQFTSFSKFSPGGIQLLGFNQSFFTNVLIPYQEKQLASTSIVWKADLDAEAIIPPKVVRNKIKDEYEIIVQDAMYRLYLIGKDGNIRWKRQLDSPILSDIHEVDIYADDRSQLMFNTADMMYLIDHNGTDEERKGYPRRLRDVTNGMAVFDYYNNKDYRLFIGDLQGNIFAYEKAGEPITGWSPKADIGILEEPVQHFLAAKKDYHVALTNKGQLHLLDVRGKHHVPPTNLEGVFPSGFACDVAEKPYRIVAVDDTGIVRVANLSGKFFRMSFKVGDNTDVRFTYADVLADKRKDYIVLSANNVAVYDHSEKKLECQLNDRQEDIFTIQLLGKEKRNIGTVSPSSRLIYLLDDKGRPMPGFPLAGTTRFGVSDLFDEGLDVLTVADGAVVYAYRL